MYETNVLKLLLQCAKQAVPHASFVYHVNHIVNKDDDLIQIVLTSKQQTEPSLFCLGEGKDFSDALAKLQASLYERLATIQSKNQEDFKKKQAAFDHQYQNLSKAMQMVLRNGKSDE